MVRTLQCRCIYLWPGYVDYGYVSLVVTLPGPFLYSWLITRFVTRITRWMPLVEQELPTLQEHLSSPPVFSGVRVTRSLVCCVIFCRSLFGLSFHLRILIAPFGIFKLLLDYMCMDIYIHEWPFTTGNEIDLYLCGYVIQCMYMPTPTCMNIITFINIK